MAKTNEKKGSTALAKKPTDIKEMSFADIMQLDEKELNKQISYEQKMVGKKSQLMAKITDLNLKKMKIENRFKTSLTDPTLDSVDLKLELDCIDKEISIAVELLKQLFPDTKFTTIG